MIAAALLVITLYPTYRGYIGWEEERFTEIDLSNISRENVDKISIKKGEEDTELEKRDTGWVINDLPASTKDIEDFFEKIATIKIDRLVSRNKENHDQFAVDDTEGYHLSLYKGDLPMMSIIIGKEASGFNTLYIRKEGSDNVYSAFGEIRRYVTRTANEWQVPEEHPEQEK